MSTYDERFIFSFLKQQNRPDLTKKFHNVVSMARSRQQVLTKIVALSDTLFQHGILYVLFRRNKIEVPRSWQFEIQSYLNSINALNSGKKKKWLTAAQIMNNLNDLLVAETRSIIDDKLAKFNVSIQKQLQKSLDDFFKAPKLEKLFTLKYENDKLVFIAV